MYLPKGHSILSLHKDSSFVLIDPRFHVSQVKSLVYIGCSLFAQISNWLTLVMLIIFMY